ncbi:hypothetical protein KI688_007613 [Linnemannia hyalina]|uniref:Uncharacterized protein n=1 Tax=Linnemannia hyalina TaxID=64524 RepID=A0A9P7XH09_9FUNG|nr:hypothetical protein KI688_007613 [Linnemannia hyalina]
MRSAFRKVKATGGFLEKYQEIVRFFESCDAAKKALDVERARVNKEVYKFATVTETRWDSTLTLMRRVHELAGEMAAALKVVIASSVQSEVDRRRKMKAGLSELELEEVRDLCRLLTPAAKLTHEVGGSKYPTISSAYSEIYGLPPALTMVTTGPAKEMSDALMQETELRFTVHQMPEVTIVAMFLNRGCSDYEFFRRDSNFLAKARTLAQNTLLTMADELNPSAVVDNDDDEDALLSETNNDLVSRGIDRYCQSMVHDPKKTVQFSEPASGFLDIEPRKLPLNAFSASKAYYAFKRG